MEGPPKEASPLVDPRAGARGQGRVTHKELGVGRGHERVGRVAAWGAPCERQ